MVHVLSVDARLWSEQEIDERMQAAGLEYKNVEVARTRLASNAVKLLARRAFAPGAQLTRPKPLFSSGLPLSVAHDGGVAVVAVHGGRVGIDVVAEPVEFGHDEQVELFGSVQSNVSYAFGLREAYFKMVGEWPSDMAVPCSPVANVAEAYAGPLSVAANCFVGGFPAVVVDYFGVIVCVVSDLDHVLIWSPGKHP